MVEIYSSLIKSIAFAVLTGVIANFINKQLWHRIQSSNKKAMNKAESFLIQKVAKRRTNDNSYISITIASILIIGTIIGIRLYEVKFNNLSNEAQKDIIAINHLHNKVTNGYKLNKTYKQELRITKHNLNIIDTTQSSTKIPEVSKLIQVNDKCNELATTITASKLFLLIGQISLYLCLGVCFSIFLINKESNKKITEFDWKMAIIRPNISNDEFYLLNARFAQLKTHNDYNKIMIDVNSKISNL